jgi:hypothetical protein
MIEQNLAKIRAVFERLGHIWVEPKLTETGLLATGTEGNHLGLYWIWPEVNFYFGKAATQVVHKRHVTHMCKLKADLPALYGPQVEKVQPGSVMPDGWREGVAKFLLENNIDMVPPTYEQIGKKRVKPANMDFIPVHKRTVHDIPCYVWNLNHLTAREISDIEEAVIPEIWPYCNGETYRKRKRQHALDSKRKPK